MKIGIIGSGQIGGNLGKHWAKAGHQVLFSSRHPKELINLAENAGNNARAVSVAEAFEAKADVYLLAVPFKAIDDLAEIYAGEYEDKVIIDATNPYPERDGNVAQEVRDANYNSTEYTAVKFNTAKTVKAFNTIPAQQLQNRAFENTHKLAIPFAAQDELSKTVGLELIEGIGFDACYIGDLRETNIMDPEHEIFGKSLEKNELERLIASARAY
ncbi:NAD(P)-binding domain-containing protein [Xanthomarina sp. F1114]|uniref:NADPH-dependent F420 reductase n=1 Tax=Xanthomarina sp. F1114 TaxID=2996019 RepID=UPI00225E6AD1|nr:NAD(P)-binding domain-containing protein [Xanthomarina sp. F1114]MCX7547220.1 NAD(P)-binding domain-containing protein [Xanthomarina sp. F1114]